ncbi:MAG: hypothetical protein U0871_01150 [Gemmataceae bacterium]
MAARGRAGYLLAVALVRAGDRPAAERAFAAAERLDPLRFAYDGLPTLARTEAVEALGGGRP